MSAPRLIEGVQGFFRRLAILFLGFLSGVFALAVAYFVIAAFTTGEFYLLLNALACFVGAAGAYLGADEFFPDR